MNRDFMASQRGCVTRRLRNQGLGIHFQVTIVCSVIQSAPAWLPRSGLILVKHRPLVPPIWYSLVAVNQATLIHRSKTHFGGL